MRLDYVLLPSAQNDYEASLNWYLIRSMKAAKGFAAAVDEAIALICDNPMRWHNAYAHFHELA